MDEHEKNVPDDEVIAYDGTAEMNPVYGCVYDNCPAVYYEGEWYEDRESLEAHLTYA